MFPIEGMVRAKALRQEDVRLVAKIAGRPVSLEGGELQRAGERRAEGPEGWSLVGGNEALALDENTEVLRDLIQGNSQWHLLRASYCSMHFRCVNS